MLRATQPSDTTRKLIKGKENRMAVVGEKQKESIIQLSTNPSRLIFKEQRSPPTPAFFSLGRSISDSTAQWCCVPN